MNTYTIQESEWFNRSNLTIAVDFDGTCVTHDYPKVGKDIGAIPVLRDLVSSGNDLILYTMRSGKQLQDALSWFYDNNIPLYAAQRNPTQDTWTSSPKCYAQIYIDDAALGVPLKFDGNLSHRPFIDWELVKKILIERNVLQTSITTDEPF